VAGPQRFFDPSQPQTLQIATVLLYIDAFFTLLAGSFGLPFAVVFAGAAYGMANGKKWGYILALAVAVLRLVLMLAGDSMTDALDDPIGLMFGIALVALLLHPQSREYQKIWYS
jgi:hypothetical protein